MGAPFTRWMFIGKGSVRLTGPVDALLHQTRFESALTLWNMDDEHVPELSHSPQEAWAGWKPVQVGEGKKKINRRRTNDGGRMTTTEPTTNIPQEEIIKRVRNVMMHCVGYEKKITRRELVRRVFGDQAAQSWSNNNRYDRSVRRAIETMRNTEFICSSSSSSGYWIASNMQDLETLASEYISRARKEEEKARLLLRRGQERFGGQISMEMQA
jgi:hypothetical protein